MASILDSRLELAQPEGRQAEQPSAARRPKRVPCPGQGGRGGRQHPHGRRPARARSPPRGSRAARSRHPPAALAHDPFPVPAALRDREEQPRIPHAFGAAEQLQNASPSSCAARERRDRGCRGRPAGDRAPQTPRPHPRRPPRRPRVPHERQAPAPSTISVLCREPRARRRDQVVGYVLETAAGRHRGGKALHRRLARAPVHARRRGRGEADAGARPEPHARLQPVAPTTPPVGLRSMRAAPPASSSMTSSACSSRAYRRSTSAVRPPRCLRPEHEEAVTADARGRRLRTRTGARDVSSRRRSGPRRRRGGW